MWRKIVSFYRSETGVAFVSSRLLFIQGLVFFLPHMTATRLRTMLYRLAGVQIGHGSVVMGSLSIWGKSPLVIGPHTTINSPCAFCLDESVTIGKGVMIGHHVIITTGGHEIGPHKCRGGAGAPKPIRIEDGVWIGANVTILPGVTVGAGSVVAAGAVVTKDVVPDTLVAGVPARLLRELPVGDANGPQDKGALGTQCAGTGIR